ncbi:hypothetical protein [Kribbella sp. NPDC048915]|uniref:hypothetical protein n=1 Tax=Kribbella sp. NPDC048915 TaxID=3155148 RepID=UPI00340CC2A8
MVVLRTLIAAMFIVGGLGKTVTAVHQGQLFDLVVAVALFAVALAVWPHKPQSV